MDCFLLSFVFVLQAKVVFSRFPNHHMIFIKILLLNLLYLDIDSDFLTLSARGLSFGVKS